MSNDILMQDMEEMPEEFQTACEGYREADEYEYNIMQSGEIVSATGMVIMNLSYLWEIVGAGIIESSKNLGTNLKNWINSWNKGGSGAGKYQGPDLKISDKQFGKKVGKHAEDFGLDAKSPDSRKWVRDKINDIFKNPTQIKEGEWRGLGPIQESGNNAPGPARFFIQENDVVVTDLDGNFVTILKDGFNNGRVVGAVKIWP